MTIKHKCQRKIVSNEAIRKTENHKSYSEHAAMHYGDGWSYWTTTIYLVKKCKKCGKEHVIKESELL